MDFSDFGSDNNCDKNNANEDFPEPYGPTSDHARGWSLASKRFVNVDKVLSALDVGM